MVKGCCWKLLLKPKWAWYHGKYYMACSMMLTPAAATGVIKKNTVSRLAMLAGRLVHMGKPIMHQLCTSLLLICPASLSLFSTFTIKGKDRLWNSQTMGNILHFCNSMFFSHDIWAHFFQYYAYIVLQSITLEMMFDPLTLVFYFSPSSKARKRSKDMHIVVQSTLFIANMAD